MGLFLNEISNQSILEQVYNKNNLCKITKTILKRKFSMPKKKLSFLPRNMNMKLFHYLKCSLIVAEACHVKARVLWIGMHGTT